jgi:hypothetical protein
MLNTILGWCADARAALESIHPVAPWLVLAGLCFGADRVLRHFGWAALIERRFPWGKVATTLIASLPVTVLGAAWPAITSGDTDPASAVKGAVARVALPLGLAVWAWLPKPPSAGTGAALLVVLVTGCTALSPAEHAERETCLAQVFLEMDARANAECHARDIDWDECPAREHIMADYTARQRSCPHAR